MQIRLLFDDGNRQKAEASIKADLADKKATLDKFWAKSKRTRPCEL